jgi:hypothetical protein
VAAAALGIAVLASACGWLGRPTSSPRPAASPSGQVATAPPTAPAIPGCPAGRPVVDPTSLKLALSTAMPGTVISLAAGTYSGHFLANVSGTEAAPISLCGAPDAVIDGGGVKTGYALHVDKASWWRLVGFSIRGAQKGLVVDHGTHILISGLHISGVGDEALHLREFSTDNIVERVTISGTGVLRSKFGEGIYVGTAVSNWCQYTGCSPDASDRNLIRDNDISETTAENIDIKEGTTGGQVTGNHLSGLGMVASAGTAWINAKGNGWTISGNAGHTSPKDGFQVHQVAAGWGRENVFRANQASVEGPGYGFYVQLSSLGTILSCDNQVVGAGAGFSNARCTP